MTTACIALAVATFFGGCCVRSAWFHRVKLKAKLFKLIKGIGYYFSGVLIVALCIGMGKLTSETPWLVIPISFIPGYAVRCHWKGIK